MLRRNYIMVKKTHHQQVIKEEDLPLVNSTPLGSIGVRDFIQLTTAH